MPKKIFSRPVWLFGNVAVLILCVVFFLVPFAMRGARLSIQDMKNDVKDWLPRDFRETEELAWFKDNFLGEQFVLITWEGCTEDDPAYQMLVEKLRAETEPPPVQPLPGETVTAEQSRRLENARARDIGDKYGLHLLDEEHFNWGGREEKWLGGRDDTLFYITPDGSLYRWKGRTDILAAVTREIRRQFFGATVEGERVAQLGTPAVGEENPFYDEPRKLTARLFKSFYSGPIVLERLTHPPVGDTPAGPLWPRSSGSDADKAAAARELAMRRLVGALYGPDMKQTAIVVTLSEVAKGRSLPRGRPAGAGQTAGQTARPGRGGSGCTPRRPRR